MKLLRFAVLFLMVALLPAAIRAQGAPGSVTWTGTPHGVSLACTGSVSSTVAGYNFYRGTVTGGPYTKLNAAPLTTCAYLDPASGLTVSTTYFYVATAVDSKGNESAYSNQATVVTPATFPQDPQAPSALSGTVQ